MKFHHYFKSRQGEMIKVLKELVHLESPSSDKKAVDRCSSFTLSEFKKIGASVTRYVQKEIGDLHLVVYPASKKERKDEQILVLTHIDTVWPVGKIKEMPFYISGNKLFGPGVLDMKAGITMALYSLKTINELNIQPQKNIAVFINSAEEIGADVSDKLILDLARESACVLCLEPSLPGGSLKCREKDA